MSNKLTWALVIALILTLSSSTGLYLEKTKEGTLKKIFRLYIEGKRQENIRYFASLSNETFTGVVELVDPDKDSVYSGNFTGLTPGKYRWIAYYIKDELSEVIGRGEEWLFSNTVNEIFWSWTGIIRGEVWLDANENGERDYGEKQLPNVEILLYKLMNDTHILYATSISNDSGMFVFQALPPGTYHLEVGGNYVSTTKIGLISVTRLSTVELSIGVKVGRERKRSITKVYELRVINPLGAPKGVKYYVELRNSTHLIVKEFKSYTFDVYRASMSNLSPGFYSWEVYYVLGVARHVISSSSETLEKDTTTQVSFAWPVDKTFKLDVFYSEYVPYDVRFFAEVSYDRVNWITTELKPWGVGGTGSKFPGAWLGKMERLAPGHVFYRVYYVRWGVKYVIKEGTEELMGRSRINVVKYTWPIRLDAMFVPIHYPYIQISPDGNSATARLDYKLILTPLTTNLSKYGFIGEGIRLFERSICVYSSHVTPRTQLVLYTEPFKEDTVFEGYIKAIWDWPLTVSRINVWYGLLGEDPNTVIWTRLLSTTSNVWIPIRVNVRAKSRIAIGYGGGTRDTIMLLYLCLRGGVGVRGANKANIIGVMNSGDVPILVRMRFRDGGGATSMNISLQGVPQISIIKDRIVKYVGEWVKLNPGEVGVVTLEIAGKNKYSYVIYVDAADEWGVKFERLQLKIYGG